MITPSSTTNFKPCSYCGSMHSGTCSRVAAIEYYPNGTVKRVELHPQHPVVMPVPNPTITPISPVIKEPPNVSIPPYKVGWQQQGGDNIVVSLAIDGTKFAETITDNPERFI